MDFSLGFWCGRAPTNWYPSSWARLTSWITLDAVGRGRLPAEVRTILRQSDPSGSTTRGNAAATSTISTTKPTGKGITRRRCPWSHIAALVGNQPLEVWKAWADDVSGGPIPAGHFIPEEAPDETTRRLVEFLA
jgi:haloacetate dehalogenase